MIDDPFATIPDADPDQIETRAPFLERDNTCGLVGKPRSKRTDLNPLQRRWFEREGYTYARVEHANAFGGVNVDLWGFADYLACKPGEGIVLIQTTDITSASKREKKARSKPELWVWLAAGGRFQVHAWKQPGGPGSRWEMVVREVTP